MGIRNVHYHPFAIASFQCIFHGHAAIQRRFVVRMKRDGGVSLIFGEGHISGRESHAIQVETGMAVKTFDNSFLHFLLTL